jgi:hypothetical protein
LPVRRRRGCEEDRPDGECGYLRASVQEVGHRELEQHNHEVVAREKEPDLSIGHLQKVLGVDG